MSKQYRTLGELQQPLTEADRELTIKSLTALLREKKPLVIKEDGEMTRYDVELIGQYFDLKDGGYNTPDKSVSLLSEVTGDIAMTLIYGMSEGMTYDKLISAAPGSFKVYNL